MDDTDIRKCRLSIILWIHDNAALSKDELLIAPNTTPGIYFYKLTAGKYSEVKKLQLLK